jgi:hypothetical protein
MTSQTLEYKCLESASSSSLPSIAVTDDASTSSSHSDETVSHADDDDDMMIKAVSFGVVEVREYNRIVGDHPEVRFGPPLTISWDYYAHPPVYIDTYETTHVHKKPTRMSSITRRNLLQNVFGATDEEIQQSEKECQKIQKRREQSKQQVLRIEKVQSKRKSVKRFVYNLLVKTASIPAMSMPSMSVVY